MRLANETVRFLKDNLPEKTGQPVFAFLSFYAVHGPIQTTQEKWAKYRQKAEQMGIAPTGVKMRRDLHIRKVKDNHITGGRITAMHAAAGVVLPVLEPIDLLQTIIVI